MLAHDYKKISLIYYSVDSVNSDLRFENHCNTNKLYLTFRWQYSKTVQKSTKGIEKYSFHKNVMYVIKNFRCSQLCLHSINRTVVNTRLPVHEILFTKRIKQANSILHLHFLIVLPLFAYTSTSTMFDEFPNLISAG